MKRLIILLTAVLPILLMGCVKDDTESVRRDGDGVTFTAETYGNLTQFSFKTGDKIGVYMKKTGLPLATANIVGGVSNYSYVYDAAAFKPELPSGKIVIPDGTEVDFVAYSPKLTGTNISNFVYSIDVSDQTVPDNIDILYSNNAVKKEKVFRDVKLVFRHKLSKIHLDITGDLTAAQKTTIANVKVVGLPTQGTLDLNTEALSTVSASVANLDMYEKAKDEHEVIVIPHKEGDGYSGRKMTLTADGFAYEGIIPNDHNFRDGFAYTYELFIGVGNTASELTLKHVVPWGLNEEIDFSKEITQYFTDPVFKQWVFDNCCGGREVIFVGDVVGRADVDLSGELPNTIGSLAGIEFFISLENLIAPNQNITTIDIGKSLFVKTIDLNNNKLSAIDVTNNYFLEFLDVSYDPAFAGAKITNIDLTGNRELTYLSTSWSDITSFDLSSNRKIKTLLIDGEGLETMQRIFGLDYSGVDLETLSIKGVYYSDLSKYNFYGADKVFLGSNEGFTSFDISGVERSGNVTDFSMTKAINMSELVGLTQNITTLTLSECGFEKIDLRTASNLTKLTLTGNPGVEYGGAADKRLYITVTNVMHTNLTNLNFPQQGADLGGGVIAYYLNQDEIDEHITHDFTDPVFRQWVLTTFCSGATKIYRSNVETQTQIVSNASSPLPRLTDATSLNGIEHFKALTSLDVSANTNSIKKIDLRKNTELTSIFLENGTDVMTTQPIEELNIEGLTKLLYFTVNTSTIKSIDFHKDVNLHGFAMQNAFGIKKIDLRNMSNLFMLNMQIKGYPMEPVLEEINVEGMVKLYGMFIEGHRALKRLHVRNCPMLNQLYSGNPITPLLQAKSALESVKLNGCVGLLDLMLMGGDALTEVDLTGCDILRSITIYNSKITTLDLSKTPRMRSMNLANNAIEELDISNHSKTMERLDVTGNPGKNGFVTVYAWFDNNSVPTGATPPPVGTYNFTDPTVPWTVNGASVSVNYLHDVTRHFVDDVFRDYVRTTFCGGRERILTSDLVGKDEIYIWGLGVKSVSGIEFFPDLTQLYAGNEKVNAVPPAIKNNINYIDVSNNPKLTTLSMNDQVDGIAEVNITGCTELATLLLNAPSDPKYRLKSLNVAHCKDMTNFQIQGSALGGELDLSGNPSLMYIYMNNGKKGDIPLVVNFNNCTRLREIQVMGLNMPIVDISRINSPELYNVKIYNCGVQEITLPNFNQVATGGGAGKKITIDLQNNELNKINNEPELDMGINAPNGFLKEVSSLAFAVGTLTSVTVASSDKLERLDANGIAGGSLTTLSVKNCPNLITLISVRNSLRAASTIIENCPTTTRIDVSSNLLESLNIPNLGNNTAKLTVYSNPGDLITNDFIIKAPAGFTLANLTEDSKSWKYPWNNGPIKTVKIEY